MRKSKSLSSHRSNACYAKVERKYIVGGEERFQAERKRYNRAVRRMERWEIENSIEDGD